MIIDNLIPSFALHLNRSKHEQASQLSLQGKMSHSARNFSSGWIHSRSHECKCKCKLFTNSPMKIPNNLTSLNCVWTLTVAPRSLHLSLPCHLHGPHVTCVFCHCIFIVLHEFPPGCNNSSNLLFFTNAQILINIYEIGLTWLENLSHFLYEKFPLSCPCCN